MVARGSKPDSIKKPPFETDDLRQNLARYLDSDFDNPVTGQKQKVGNFRWGVYAFFDYDGEPIYVGQTNEMLRTRIRRHLTNQRTDAVAMSVLDPFEVYEIEVWPLPQFDKVVNKKAATDADRQAFKQAKAHLDALERTIYETAVAESEFKAVLNEKDPPRGSSTVPIPSSFRMKVVSNKVYELRSHPDFRIARRALIIARLAQVISERQVQGGLRRVLLTQAKRLQWLADRRYAGLGGAASVKTEDDEDEEHDTED
jgi:hypothetical protein